MKQLFISLFILLTAIASLEVSAQTSPTFSLTGQVVNDQGEPVDYATVQLRHQ